MKNFILTMLISAFFGGSISSAFAQQTQGEEKVVGGFGHFFIGPGLIQNKKVTDYLKKADVLGSTYSPSSLGYTIGGEGMAYLNRFIIGGGGFGLVSPSYSTDSARALTAMGGGYFKIGYTFYNKANTFMYAYTSFGGSGYSVQLSNLAETRTVNFNHKDPIQPGKIKTYGFGGFLFDFGVSLKTMAIGKTDENDRKKGGLMVGVDLGCFVTMPVSEWDGGNTNNNGNNNTDNRIAVVGPPTPSASLSPYLRITIGGGGFKRKF